MKNLDKINPEKGIILSDREMKEIAGGTYRGDTCVERNQCNAERCMSSSVPTGYCWNPTGESGGCKCVKTPPIILE